MAPSTFQTALYKEYRALYVSPISQLAPRLNLLDVMIQTDSEGLVPRRPVLHRVGSMLDLGTNSSEPAQEKLRKGLESFWAGKGSTDDTFYWSRGDVPEFEETLSSASSLTGSLFAGLKVAKAHFSESKELQVSIGQLDAACVKWEVLGKMMAESNNPSHWKPNVSDFRLKKTIGRNKIVLWVVRDLLYARTMVIKTTSGSEKEIKLLPGVASAAVAVSGVIIPGVEVIKSDQSANSLGLRPVIGDGSPASRVPNKSLIAFRLVGFVFNATGSFKGYKNDTGSVEPIHRAPTGRLSHGDERAQIRDLYKKTAPEYYSDEEESEEDSGTAIADLTKMDLQRFPIVDTDTGDLDEELKP